MNEILKNPDDDDEARLLNIWRFYANRTPAAEGRDDYRFDPAFYASQDLTLTKRWPDLRLHFNLIGQKAGRAPNRYQQLKRSTPDFDETIERLITQDDIRVLLTTERELALELAFELINLGPGIDEFVSNFCGHVYLSTYPDVAHSNMDPLDHYLQNGRIEGRRLLGDIKSRLHSGNVPLDPEKQTCLVCCSSLKKLMRNVELSGIFSGLEDQYNVYVVSAQEDALIEPIEDQVCGVIFTSAPNVDLKVLLPLQDHPKGLFGLAVDVDAAPILNALVPLHIPFSTLISERRSTSGTGGMATCIALFSEVLAFTSQPILESWKPTLTDLNVSNDAVHILRPKPGALARKLAERRRDIMAERRSTRQVLRRVLGRPLDGKHIVVGSGPVSWQAGTDLFAMVATIAKRMHPELVFVWQGDGPNHEDKSAGMWLHHHITAAVDAGARDQNFFLLPDNYEGHDFSIGADAYFHCSRSESDLSDFQMPLITRRPITVFEGVSFFDDPYWRSTAQRNGTKVTLVPFGDLTQAVRAIAGSVATERDTDLAPKQVRKIRGVLSELAALQLESVRAKRIFSVGGGTFDVPISQPPMPEFEQDRRRERDLAWTNKRRFVWRQSDESLDLCKQISDPALANSFDISRDEFAATGTCPHPFNVHIHAYYVAEFLQDLERYRLFWAAENLVVTTDSERKRGIIERSMHNAGIAAHVLVLPNQGRDILPFMRIVQEFSADPNEIWVHLHAKKSVALQESGRFWKDYLFRAVAGDDRSLSAAADLICDPKIGLVTAFDPFVPGFGPSRQAIGTLTPAAQAALPDHPGMFPVGNMFWTKTAVVRQLSSYFDDGYAWPNEPIANDGTVYHLIERLWQIAAHQAGYRSTFLHLEGMRRL